MDYSENLYMYTPRFCIPYCKEWSNTTEERCDYSSKTDCGTMRSGSGVCSFKEEYCGQNSLSWDELKNGTTIKDVYIPGVETKFFRFFLDKPCTGFTIHIDRSFGKIWYAIKRGEIPSNHSPANWDRMTNVHDMTYCPREVNFGYGTWYVGVWTPEGFPLKFDITLHTFDLNMDREVNIGVKEDWLNQNGFLEPKWEEGVNVYFKRRTPSIVELKVTSCFQFMFHKEILWYGAPQILAFMIDEIAVPQLNRYNFLRWFQPPVITVCPKEGQNETLIYMGFVTPEADMNATLYYSLISESWNAKKIPITSFNEWSGEELLQGLFNVLCGETLYHCYPGASEYGTSCNQVWVSMPRHDKNPLWPIPRYFLDDQLYRVEYESQNQTTSPPLIGNQLRISLLLEYYYGSSSLVTYSDWRLTFESECRLVSLPYSIITTESGEFNRFDIPIQGLRKQLECEYDEFRVLSKNIDQLTYQLTQSSDLRQILSLRFQVDVQTLTTSWQKCNEKVTELLEPVSKLEISPPSTLCNIDMMKNDSIRQTDACCNETLKWEQCCVPRSIETKTNTYQLKNRDEIQCKDSDCVQKLLEDYLFYDQLTTSVTGCGAVVTQSLEMARVINMRFYTDCKFQVFGEDFKGKKCSKNSDCSSGTCDHFKKLCLYLNDDQIIEDNRSFFQCLVSTMPSSLREPLISKVLEGTKADEVTDSQLEEALLETYSIQECVSDIGRTLDGQHYTLTDTIGIATCGINDWFCLDWNCPIPMRSETGEKYGRDSSTCRRYKEEGGSLKCGDWVCNWNETVVDSEFDENRKDQCLERTTGFCAVCESPTSCVVIEDIGEEEECTSKGEVCFGANGEYLLDVESEEECEMRGSVCSIPCQMGDGSKCDKSTCEQKGVCSDLELYPYVSVPVPDPLGYCKSPMTPWNIPDCNRSNEQNAINIGAVLGSDFPRNSFCIRTINQTRCESFSDREYRWHTWAQNKEECEQHMTCIESNTVPTSLRTIKSEEECGKCGGKYETAFKWSQGEWQSATMKKVEWKEPEYVNLFREGPSIDFGELASFLEDIVVNDYTLQLVTEVQCRLNPVKSIVEKTLCVCEKGFDDCEYLEKDKNVAVGIGEVCPQDQSLIVAPPSLIEFTENSTSSCVEILVYSTLQENLQSSSQARLSLSFRENSKSQENVWNENGATIGKTIGDGISLELKPSETELREVTICMSFDETESSKDRVQDFGVRRENKVYPLSLRTTISNSLLCVKVNRVNSQENEFYPIVRDQDWSTTQEDSYSDSQVIIYSIVLVLYFSLFCGIVAHQLSLGTIWQINRWFDVFLALAVAVRSLYFLLLLVLQPDGQESVTEFLGLEFPTFAYLSSVSIAATLWALVSSSGIQKQTSLTSTQILRISILINVLMYILLIIVTILFFVFESSESSTCYSKIYSEPDTKQHDRLRIVYVSIITAVTAGIVTIIIKFGGSIAFNLDISKSEKGSTLRLRGWIIVTIIMSLSVILQCVFMLIYSLALEPSYEYSIVLIFIEILPIAFIIYFQVQSRLQSKRKSSTNENNTVVPDQFTSKEESHY